MPRPSPAPRRRIQVLALLIAAGFLVSGCSDSGPGTDARLTVVASTPVLADVVAAVAGDGVEVVQILPDGVSEHDFQLSAADRARIDDADLLVLNGASLEAALPLDNLDAPTFTVAEHAGTLLEAGGVPDPHLWMDPTRMARALPALADSLGGLDPSDRAAYVHRARAYARSLQVTDRQVSRILAAVPPDRRLLVTSHDAFSYFADRYGFEILGSAFGTAGPDAAPSAAGIDEVIAAVREAGLPAVFAQREDDPAVLEQIASESGARAVEGLYVASPPPGGDYRSMLVDDARLIAGALGS